TRWPCSASATPRLSVVVVFATPPFWFAKAMTLAVVGPLPLFVLKFGRGSRRASPTACSFRVTLPESFCDIAYRYGAAGRRLLRCVERETVVEADVVRLARAVREVRERPALPAEWRRSRRPLRRPLW